MAPFGPKRCRVVLANNLMAGATHLWANARLESDGASALVSGFEPRRNLFESVWLRPAGDGALLFLIQTVPQAERSGRGWQGTAAVSKASPEKLRELGLAPATPPPADPR